jgi:hypothetical protein
MQAPMRGLHRCRDFSGDGSIDPSPRNLAAVPMQGKDAAVAREGLEWNHNDPSFVKSSRPTGRQDPSVFAALYQLANLEERLALYHRSEFHARVRHRTANDLVKLPASDSSGERQPTPDRRVRQRSHPPPLHQ